MIPRLVVAVVAATAPVLALGPATAAKRGAAAATPFTITAAKKVSGATVAVDSGNTGHFAWIEHPASGSDLLRYCRIPRGGTACQAQKSWPLGNTSTVPQQVLTVGKKVVIAASSCCFNDTPTGAHLLAVVSEDGGSTFAEPVLVGTLMPGGRAVVGPGTSQISVATGLDSSGVRFQAAPLDRKTEAFANLGEGFGPGRWYNGSIGYVAATVPLVAVSDLNRVYWREWSGAGDYNSAGTWGKTTLLGKGDEPLLAGGSRGVFLLYALDVPNKDQYVVRRFDAAAHTFGAATGVSEVGDPIFRDFVQDEGGHLHAVWISNGGSDPLRYRASYDGETWNEIETLVAAPGRAFNLRVGAGEDGGGWVLWDGNSAGPIRAVAIPPTPKPKAGAGGGGAGCPDVVTFGIAEARATVGCLKKEGASYTSTKPVRVNGIDLLPSGGGKIALTPGARTVSAKGTVIVRAGNVVLDKGPVSWTVPKSGSGTVDEFADISSYGAELLGFPVVGKASLVLQAKVDGSPGARIPVNVKLPPPFVKATAASVLRANNKTPLGLILDGTTLDAGDVFAGPLLVRNLHVAYKSGKLFDGHARFLLPPFYSEPGVAVGFGFDDGAFEHAEGTVTFKPTLPLSPPLVFLHAVGVALSTGPLKLTGGVELEGGPSILGQAALRMTALPPKGLVFTLADPSTLRATGKLAVVSIPVASGFVEYSTAGFVSFGGGLDWSVPHLIGVKALIPPKGGFLDLTSGAFMAKAVGKGTMLDFPFGEVDVVLSSKGAGACLAVKVGIPPVFVHVRAGAKWGQAPTVVPGLSSCDLGSYEVSKSARRRLSSAAAARSFTLPAGLEQATVAVAGSGGAPVVSVKGPGVSIATPTGDRRAARKGNAAILVSPEAKTTYLLLSSPKAGRYTVSERAGSKIAKLRVAQGLPAWSLKVRVTGNGRARVLEYTSSKLGNRTVELFERAGGAFSRIGPAAGPRGTIRFTPAAGPAGRRNIVALVSLDGVPSGERVVGSYANHGQGGLGRPARLRVTRGFSTLGAGWDSVAGAARYVVRVQLDDGRQLTFVRPPGKRTVRVAGLRPATTGTVTVQALGADGRRGPLATAPVARARGK